MVRVLQGGDGSVLDVGRRSRTVPPALRRALEVRDRGCRFPGCGLRFTDAHHLRHWADGGRTDLDNLILLCRHHHRLVHEEGWRVRLVGPDRTALFIDPRGGFHARRRESVGDSDEDPSARTAPPITVWPRERPSGSAAALVAGNRARGVEPDPHRLRPLHRPGGTVPWPLRARALEALDAAHFGA